jgi:hypothetical protein
MPPAAADIGKDLHFPKKSGGQETAALIICRIGQVSWPFPLSARCTNRF